MYGNLPIEMDKERQGVNPTNGNRRQPTEIPALEPPKYRNLRPVLYGTMTGVTGGKVTDKGSNSRKSRSFGTRGKLACPDEVGDIGQEK